MSQNKPAPEQELARLLESYQTASLATVTPSGAPQVSYVPVAIDEKRRFLFFVSELSEHTGNLKANPLASLMLTLEALFTAMLARLLYGETMDRRVWAAMLLLLAGGIALVLDQGRQGGSQLWGLLAVLVATMAWGGDNTLSRALAERDPGQVVLGKAILGASATAILAVVAGDPLPTLGSALGLMAVGATGYGLSLRFYLLAQRAFGAARTGSVFAFAPFIGAAIAIALGDRSGTWVMAVGGLLMVLGVVLHLAESHGHEHAHERLEHEHAHRHDDGHHNHTHDPMPVGAHSHPHVHEPMVHAHPHVPDAHHRHEH